MFFDKGVTAVTQGTKEGIVVDDTVDKSAVKSVMDPNEIVKLQPWYNSGKIPLDPSSTFSLMPYHDTFESILNTIPKGVTKGELISSSGIQIDAGQRFEHVLENVVGKSTRNEEEKNGDGGKDKENTQQDDDDTFFSDENNAKKGNGFPEGVVDSAREAADQRLTGYRKEVERLNEIIRNSIAVESSSGGGSSSSGKGEDREERRRKKEGKERSRK